MFKIAFKYIGFRYRQHRRKTSEKLVVDTVYGPVRGVKRISCWDDPYYSFERIPFAKPPVGELRFADPQPPEPWTNVLDGTEEGPGPVQCQMGTRVTGDENCLFVNVFTKDLSPSTLKPVMVWIHGGGFALGSTSRTMYGPDYLMSKDIVLVSVAYRVGIFGFLSLNDPSLKIPGNAGLKDQILALKWIQENVSRFGGDPNNVTLFGESAGGASVHMLGLTERTKGLFHRMICSSGSALCGWATPPRKDWLPRILKKLGYTGEENEHDMLKFLRSMKAKKISAAEANVVSKEDQHEGYIWASYPVIEPYATEQCVLAKDPVELSRNAWSNEIPMITGCTSREGMTFRDFADKSVYKAWQEDPVLMLPFNLKPNAEPAKRKELAERVKKEHFGEAAITDIPYIDYLTFKHFWHGIHRMVLSRQKHSTAPTYLYNFEYDSPANALIKNIMGLDYPGVAHGDELSYLFTGMFVKEPQPGSMDRKKIEQYVGMFAQFAQNGDPNCSELGSVKWEPVAAEDNPEKCLRFGQEVTYEPNPYAEKLAFWDSLYDSDELF